MVSVGAVRTTAFAAEKESGKEIGVEASNVLKDNFN